MRELPHVPGYTLAADAFMGPDESVGFSVAHHPLSVFQHFHDFYELAFVLRGTGHHLTDEGTQTVHRGSAIFVAPGVSHGYELCDGLVVYNCFLRAEAARFDLSWAQRDARLGRLFPSPGQTPSAPVVVTLDEAALSACVGHLDAIRERPAAERGEAFELGHLLLTLDALGRELEDERTDRSAPVPTAPALVVSAARLLEQDLRARWTLDALSAELHVDAYHLVRLFKRWMGTPPIAWANRLRAERAAVLLTGTDEPVAAIGAEVGWPDASHFSRRFRQELGVSPRAYRRRSREHRPAPPGVPAEVRPDPDGWSPSAVAPAPARGSGAARGLSG
jgi:AraC family L-rhamnose operon transcriptional activator RhaR